MLANVVSSPSGRLDLAVFPLILVLSTPPLVWFARYWTIYIDSAEYLILASNLISGQGYTHVGGHPQLGRGPVLPAVIGTLMVFFGRDTESLAWVVRLLALANPLLAYLLMKRISGPGTGLLAAALVTLFSYTATTIEAFNIDAVLLTVYLLALLTLLISVQTRNSTVAFLSGLFLGLSILTKETSFTNLPIAVIVALLLGWSLRGVLWHYLGIIIVCLPWWTWVWLESREVYLVGSLPAGLRIPALTAVLLISGLAIGLYVSGLPAQILGSVRRRRWVGWMLATVWTIVMSVLLLTTSVALEDSSPGAIRRYLSDNLAGYTPLWPALLVAGGYVAWKAIRGSALWQFFAVALVIQIPVCLLATVEGFSLRQFLTPQTLLLCALAALIVEFCATAVQRRAFSGRLMIAVAASFGIFLLLSAVGQVNLLLGEPDSWTSLDRTSRVKPENVRVLRGIRKMDRWTARNVPEGEGILFLEVYSNYQVFLDGGQHRWAPLQLDCGVGSRTPTTEGCVPSKAVAATPPKPTVWFSLDETCKAVALSMPSLSEQMKQSKSNYLMMSDNFKYPGVVESTSYLTDSGGFEVAHEEQLGKREITGNSQAFVLLRKTREVPDPAPTRMNAQTVNQLIECEKARGSDNAQEIRSRFPNGIALEPASSRGPLPDDEAESIARANEAIEEIYPNQ